MTILLQKQCFGSNHPIHPVELHLLPVPGAIAPIHPVELHLHFFKGAIAPIHVESHLFFLLFKKQ